MKVPIFNPLNKNVVVKWDTSGDNPKEFILNSKEITYIDKEFANHVKKQLADVVFDDRYSYKKDREIQMKEIYSIIEPQ